MLYRRCKARQCGTIELLLCPANAVTVTPKGHQLLRSKRLSPARTATCGYLIASRRSLHGEASHTDEEQASLHAGTAATVRTPAAPAFSAVSSNTAVHMGKQTREVRFTGADQARTITCPVGT